MDIPRNFITLSTWLDYTEEENTGIPDKSDARAIPPDMTANVPQTLARKTTTDIATGRDTCILDCMY